MCSPPQLILPRSSRPQYSFIDRPLWEDQQLDAEESEVRHGLLPARGRCSQTPPPPTVIVSTKSEKNMNLRPHDCVFMEKTKGWMTRRVVNIPF